MIGISLTYSITPLSVSVSVSASFTITAFCVIIYRTQNLYDTLNILARIMIRIMYFVYDNLSSCYFVYKIPNMIRDNRIIYSETNRRRHLFITVH